MEELMYQIQKRLLQYEIAVFLKHSGACAYPKRSACIRVGIGV